MIYRLSITSCYVDDLQTRLDDLSVPWNLYTISHISFSQISAVHMSMYTKIFDNQFLIKFGFFFPIDIGVTRTFFLGARGGHSSFYNRISKH